MVERLPLGMDRSVGAMEIAWKTLRKMWLKGFIQGVGRSPGTMEIAWKALRKVWLKGFIRAWAAALEPWKLLGRHSE